MKDKALVYAKHKGARTSVKKVNPVLKLIRGKSVGEASRILKFHQSKASDLTLEVLKSAIANAKVNLNLSEANLYVADAYVNEGITRKWYQIVAKSRTNPLRKRTAHIVIGLSERNK